MKPLSLLVIFTVCWSAVTHAADLRVAVASNFAPLMRILGEEFAADTPHALILIPGSTGKHYAQIRNGAPFDVFFAADVARPRLLEQQGHAVASTRFTYALGQLVLWSKRPNVLVKQELLQQRFNHLAIANPDLAPYGRAAWQVLDALGMFDSRSAAEQMQSKLVRGENVAQAYQFVATGNAELGLLAWSQVQGTGEGSFWNVPDALYQPIEQQAIMLRRSEAAEALFSFMRSGKVREAIQDYGYAMQ